MADSERLAKLRARVPREYVDKVANWFLENWPDAQATPSQIRKAEDDYLAFLDELEAQDG